MTVYIGEIETFPHVQADKSQVVKIGEECMEVFSAWEDYDECANENDGDMCDGCFYEEHDSCCLKEHLVDEIADTIQACANLAAALGVDDMRCAMKACEERNRERGRL